MKHCTNILDIGPKSEEKTLQTYNGKVALKQEDCLINWFLPSRFRTSRWIERLRAGSRCIHRTWWGWRSAWPSWVRRRRDCCPHRTHIPQHRAGRRTPHCGCTGCHLPAWREHTTNQRTVLVEGLSVEHGDMFLFTFFYCTKTVYNIVSQLSVVFCL